MTEDDIKMKKIFDTVLETLSEIRPLCDEFGCKNCPVYETCRVLGHGLSVYGLVCAYQERRKDRKKEIGRYW